MNTSRGVDFATPSWQLIPIPNQSFSDIFFSDIYFELPLGTLRGNFFFSFHLGHPHHPLCLAGLSLPLFSPASAFLICSTKFCGKDKPNNTTENSHSSMHRQSIQFDQSPLFVPLQNDREFQPKLRSCEALQKSLQPSGPVVSKEPVCLTLGDKSQVFSRITSLKDSVSNKYNIGVPVFGNILWQGTTCPSASFRYRIPP